MRTWRGGLPAAEAGRLSALMADACAERGRGWSADELRRLSTQAGVATVAEADGFGIVRSVAGEAEVLMLAVAPEARGKGLGRALLGELMAAAAADGAGRMILEVAQGNIPARRLYARAGFAAIARRAGYFTRADGGREDALVLAADTGAASPAAD